MLVTIVTKATANDWFDGVVDSIMVKIEQPHLVAKVAKVASLGQKLVVGCVVVRVFVGISIVGQVVVLL